VTMIFPRTLVAALSLSSLVGVALAQQSSSDAPTRRTTSVRTEAAEPRRESEDVFVPARALNADPTTTTTIHSVPMTLFGQQGNVYKTFSAATSEETKLARNGEALVHRLAEAKNDSDRDKAKGELRDVLEKQFDLRQVRHDKEIDALEAQVKKLKDLVRKRNDNRREIISKRLDQILSDAEGLGW
jgi:hypothetical protein